MIDDIFSFLEKLVRDFTWGRMTFLVSLLLLFVIGITTFEFYTNHFRLERLEREAKVVVQLAEVSKQIESLPKTSPQRVVYERILIELERDLTQPSFNGIAIPSTLLKILFNMFPWLILMAIVLISTTDGRRSAFLGVFTVSILPILVGINLPEFKAGWINKFLYPWGIMFFIAILAHWMTRRIRAS